MWLVRWLAGMLVGLIEYDSGIGSCNYLARLRWVEEQKKAKDEEAA